MNKGIRGYIGLILAIISYYIIHEGAHLLAALSMGAFRSIKLIGIWGVQIDAAVENMTSVQFAVFNLVGVAATLIAGWLLVYFAEKFSDLKPRFLSSLCHYITVVMLFLDPFYMSLLCTFVGGGDMNGIKLIFPETAVRIAFGVILLINGQLFIRLALPKYTAAFASEEG